MIFEHENNRNAWNEAATTYQAEINRSVEFLKNGGKNFSPPELNYLRDLDKWCGKAIHLQCAGGTDTLSLLNLGAKEVIGIDISDTMIEVAKTKSDRLGSKAKWIRSDILDLPNHLNESADLVYTGRGAINWIMDLDAWGKVVSRILKPGAVLYLFEGHPLTYFFNMKASTLTIDSEFEGYFSNKTYVTQDWPDTYVGKLKDSVKDQATKYEKAWPVFRIINALLDAGLTLEKFEEHPDAYWSEFPNLPENERIKFPNTFSLLMRKAPRSN